MVGPTVLEIDGDLSIEPIRADALLGLSSSLKRGALALRKNGSAALVLVWRFETAFLDVATGEFVSLEDDAPIFDAWRIVRRLGDDETELVRFSAGSTEIHVAA